MTIKRFRPLKDNTITNAFKSNLSTRGSFGNKGASDILEVNSIYGQSSADSLEKTRILLQFPINEIHQERVENLIPAPGSVQFYLKLFNARHTSTVPSNYSVSIGPVLENWEEGVGLDMEEFSDKDASNWISSSYDKPWLIEGGTYALSEKMATDAVPAEIVSHFSSGLEDLNANITPFVEEWVRDEEGGSTAAAGSIDISASPAVGKKYTLYSTNGSTVVIAISTTASVSTDNGITTRHVEHHASFGTMIGRISTAINDDPNFTAELPGGGTPGKTNITQVVKGFFGNTKIETDDSASTIVNFTGGTGIINNGLIIRLSTKQEDGSLKRSFYTKKFFGRNSEYFLKKPVIESQSEALITDDRHQVIRSSPTAPAGLNVNNIYLQQSEGKPRRFT